ncbi:hypothetical protein T484DRAFT_1783434 [Baffinella frigidus]|nr:hypothetical protein T484DRAFT_1783434 [Cryptophyta sp. CCMP2293]
MADWRRRGVGKKVLMLCGDYMEDSEAMMLCGDFMEDSEAMVPFQGLKSYGIEVDTVCPGKKSGETCRTAIHDFEGDQLQILLETFELR